MSDTSTTNPTKPLMQTGAEPDGPALADVETAARALLNHEFSGTRTWESSTESLRNRFTDQARVALAATLRTSAPPAHPSEALSAAINALVECSPNDKSIAGRGRYNRALRLAREAYAATVAPPRETEPRPVEAQEDEQLDFEWCECPECGFSSVQKAPFKGSLACPLCAGDSGHDVGMRTRTARASDKPEGKDARLGGQPLPAAPGEPRPVEQTGSGGAEIERLTRERDEARGAIPPSLRSAKAEYVSRERFDGVCEEANTLRANLARVTAENERLTRERDEAMDDLKFQTRRAVSAEAGWQKWIEEIRATGDARLTEAAAAGSDVAGLRARIANLEKHIEEVIEWHETEKIPLRKIELDGLRAALAASPDAGAGRTRAALQPAGQAGTRSP